MKIKEFIEKFNILIKPGSSYQILLNFNSECLMSQSGTLKMEWSLKLFPERKWKQYQFYGPYESGEKLLEEVCKEESYNLSDLKTIDVDSDN